MPVHFVVGPAGSGKTHLLRDNLVRHVQADPLGPAVLYLVPKQATFTTQRAVALDARLGGYTGVRVIAPDDLAELALVQTGRPAGARLDTAGRALLIGHLLREEGDALEHFRRSAGRPGLAAEIDQTFQEFERAGAALGDLERPAADDADFAGQSLGRKVRDLARLYRRYQTFLTEHGLDPHARQLAAPDAITTWSEARDALVLADDFYDFTVYERRILVALAGVARETFVALTMDPRSPLLADPNLLPSELGLFRRTEQTYRGLHFAFKTADVPIAPPTILTASRRWTNAGLVAASHALDTAAAKPAAAGDAVRLCLARDKYDEADVAAREVKRLLAQGYRLRDICVLARSVDSYAAHVESAFTAHDLPYFLDRRRPGVHHPLVRMVQAMGQIVQTRWGNEAVFDLLKAGLADVPPADVDLLQDYVTQHRITPAAWASDRPWHFKRVGEDDGQKRPLFNEADVTRVNALASLLRSAVGPLTTGDWADKPLPIARRVADLYHATEVLNLRAAMASRVKDADEAGDVLRRQEEEQVWSQFSDLTDRLHELLGDVPLTGVEFFRLLSTSLDGLDLAVVPPTIDQVLVGSIDRTRVGDPKACVLLGLNECDFPLCQSERPVLNDADRNLLLRSGVEIEPPTRTALLMERFLGYVALSRASEKLVLIRVECHDDGSNCTPSPFWEAVRKVVTDHTVQTVRTGIERITTPDQAVTHLLLWARRQHATITPGPDAALYQWMTSADGRVADVRNAAWRSLAYRNAPTLSNPVAAALFASPLEASVSRFESFAACPFQHFARYGLRLQRSPDPEFTVMDLGSLYHAVLDDLVGDTIRRELDFVVKLRLTPDQVREAARRLAEQVADQLFLADARSRYTLDRLEKTVLKLIRGQQVAAGIGEMRPAYTELTFGDNAVLPALELQTPAGHVVKLRGKIDRVDLDERQAAYSVIDYKLRGEELDYGYVQHGLMLQLLTYLLVLEEHGPRLTGKPLTPAAALYVKVLRGIKSVHRPSDAPDPDTEAFYLKEKPRGVISRATVGRLDPDAPANGQSRLLAYKVKKDGGFYESGNDGVEPETFDDLIKFVRRQVVDLADQIIAGDVSVSPYLIGTATPCQRCDLQSVCRIDRTINSYRALPSPGRREALEIIKQKAEAPR